MAKVKTELANKKNKGCPFKGTAFFFPNVNRLKY